MAEKLYKFHWDCGRSGDVEGLFIAEELDVKNALGSEIYFGEILGKHSEVYGSFDDDDIVTLDVSPQTVVELRKAIGTNISGYNPLDYLNDEEDE